VRSQNGIADIMRAELLRNYVGKSNAKHRRFLLFHCHNFEPKLTDREMRNIYSQFPFLGSCNKGIYVIDDPEEAEKKIRMEESRRNSVDDKIELLKQHKTFLIKRERERGAGQMNLFRGN
jgi:hypothetical protein